MAFCRFRASSQLFNHNHLQLASFFPPPMSFNMFLRTSSAMLVMLWHTFFPCCLPHYKEETLHTIGVEFNSVTIIGVLFLLAIKKKIDRNVREMDLIL